MNETQKNIKRYQAALPGIRERIAAAAMLLMVSLSMVVSATFAWYTISAAPEISMISTTVAANGNLEIALVGAEGKEPERTAVGDSTATQGQSLVNANVTWGNLVNLSDASYGISNISLRPALLTGYNMLRSPLYGATYAADGRVEKVSETYEYASWYNFGAENGTIDFAFAAGDKVTYGVRAIASVQYSNTTGQSVEKVIMADVTDYYQKAVTLYGKVVNNEVDVGGKNSIDALTALLTVYVNEQANQTLNNKNFQADYGSVVYYMYNLVDVFCQINDLEGQAILNLANLMGMKAGKLTEATFFKSIDDVIAAKEAGTLKGTYGIELTSLEDDLGRYVKNRSDIYAARVFLSTYNQDQYKPSNNPSGVYWKDIGSAVGYLVDIDSSVIVYEKKEYSINNLAAAGTGTLASMLMDAQKESGAISVIIKEGTLADTEQRLGAMLNGKLMKVQLDIKEGVPVLGSWNKPMYARVYTDATEDNPPYNSYYSYYDRAFVMSSGFEGEGGDITAKDIYGMAVDLWLRTNLENCHLILEGNVDSTEVQATCTDRDGNVVPVFTIMMQDGREVDCYSREEKVQLEEGQEPVKMKVWLNASNHTQVATEDEVQEQGLTVKEKMVVVVNGFSGENRVWEDFVGSLEAGQVAEDFTTQGAGSCYVFYANPTDQGRILNLLKAFNIAFLDANGKKLASAGLDTEHAYAINGKVTVPLVVTDGASYVDENNFEHKSIMLMEQNKATWLTAIIFLDGTLLTNDQVLEAGEIEGRLNLQFGSSVSPKNAMNNEVRYDKLQISAEATYTAPDGSVQKSNSVNNPIELQYDGKEKLVNVTLSIYEGDQPNTVSGFFVRSISATQGTRMDSEDFKPNGDGTWSATFDLSKPGNYLLRSIIVDGVEYMLEKTVTENGETRVEKNYPAVNVDGLGIQEVVCNPTGGVIMTANGYVDVNVSLKIDAAPELMPSQVRAIFEGDQDQDYAAVMTYNKGASRWEGTARIASSGTFKLNYVVMDGEFKPLDEKLQKEFLVTLGLAAEVGCTNIAEVPPEFTEPVTLKMQVKVVDDLGNELRAMTGVKLFYHSTNSTMDDNGMIAEMKWDAKSGWYVGEMLLDSPGSFVFHRLEIDKEDGYGKNEIYRATTAPRISSLSKEPPEYVANATNAYQFVPNNLGRLKDSTYDANGNIIYDDAKAVSGAIMGVWLRNTEGADLWALMRNTKGTASTADDNLMLVPSKTGVYRMAQVTDDGKNDGTIYYFDVPRNKDCSGSSTATFYPEDQDGQWIMEAICLQNVYIPGEVEGEGTIIGGDANTPEPSLDNYTDPEICYVVQLKDNTSKVVETVKVDVMKDNQAGYGGESFDGLFLEAHNTPVVNFRFTDWQGQPITDGIDTLVWNFSYDDKTDSTYGSYDGATEAPRVMTMTDDNHDGIFEAPAQKLIFAGEYKTTVLKYTYGYGAESAVGASITYKVSSLRPKVQVTKVSPTGTFNINCNPTSVSGGGFTELQGVSNVIHPDGYTADVYIQFTGTTSLLGQTWYNYKAPTVTLTLSQVSGNFQNASMVFVNENNSEQNRTYAFTPGNGLSKSNEIGFVDSNLLDGNPPVHYAGRQTNSTISVTCTDYNNTERTLTATLEAPVTINNPLAPLYLKYSVSGNGFSGTVPAMAVSPDGNTFTVVLPDNIPNWDNTTVTEVTGAKTNETNTTKDVYTVTDGGCNDDTYNYFTRHVRTYVSPITTTTTVKTYKISGWKIGSTTYKPGDTVTISTSQTATAVMSVVNTVSTPVTETYLVTEYKDVVGPTGQKNPKGEKVETTYADYTEVSRVKQ